MSSDTRGNDNLEGFDILKCSSNPYSSNSSWGQDPSNTQVMPPVKNNEQVNIDSPWASNSYNNNDNYNNNNNIYCSNNFQSHRTFKKKKKLPIILGIIGSCIIIISLILALMISNNSSSTINMSFYSAKDTYNNLEQCQKFTFDEDGNFTSEQNKGITSLIVKGKYSITAKGDKVKEKLINLGIFSTDEINNLNYINLYEIVLTDLTVNDTPANIKTKTMYMCQQIPYKEPILKMNTILGTHLMFTGESNNINSNNFEGIYYMMEKG